MDSFELNKILGALLFTLPVPAVAQHRRRGGVSRRPSPPSPASRSWCRRRRAKGGGQQAAPDEPIEKLLASAAVEKGEAAAKKCAACHTFGKGEPNRVGPNLYGVVGRERGSHAGFNYSAAMKAKPGKWTVEDLNAFLLNPKGFIPGTSMSFAGVPRGSERADLIAYLNSKSDSPAALPKAAEAPAGTRSSRRFANRSGSRCPCDDSRLWR